MGNHRFKLSDMMPNAWFYKLRDMSKVRSHNPSHSIKKNMQSSTPNPRKSFYYTTEPIRMDNKLCISPKFFDPPRKSSKKRGKRKTIYMPSPRKIAPSEAEIPIWLKPSDIDDYLESGPTSPDRADFPESSLSGFEYGPDQSYLSSSATDIIIDVDETSYMLTEFDMISEPDLPPIQTKPAVSLEESVVSNNTSIKFPIEKEKPRRNKRSSTSPGSRKSFSGGVKIRGKKSEGRRRRKTVKEEKKKGVFYSESFAIVKASFDPEKDFRESMMEMIVENNIKGSKDLEELLACYLSLNSNHYHHLIIKAFEQIWFSMSQLNF
ncbi:hypothetical protein C2S53_008600 [Perilla frutescens var. hirtella]|uniref:Transcription repressor n=1 Tax=Perilla frutescens var. hirtella TaxID=608512 RepID=A0AAD4PEE2_PERFH|nr:hypothetical protein C2S53_008600 [Perilla frutescens var. hirtella]